MEVTVRDVLALPVISDAGAEVVAGAGSLTRAVRWVHVTELPEIGHLLKGGELLLTTGLRLQSGPDQCRKFVHGAAKAGVAGVMVELGTALQAIPAGMRRDAERAELPLIALSRETKFVEVTEQVHRAIISEQYETLRRVEAIGREFSTLLLDGADTHHILLRLAEELGNPVVLENGAHQAVGFADPTDPSGAAVGGLLDDWEVHSRRAHQPMGAGPVHRAAGPPSCAWVSIWLRHDAWGRVHVLETRQQLGEWARLVLDRAGTAVGLSMLSRAEAEHTTDRAASAVIADLVNGRVASGHEVLQRARSLGSNLADGRLVALAVDAAGMEAEGDAGDRDEREQGRRRLQVRAELRSAIADHGCEGLLALVGTRILAIVSVPRTADPAVTIERIGDSLQRRLAAIQPGPTPIIGASRETTSSTLKRALEEAQIAAQSGRQGQRQSVRQFNQLGTYPLLLRLADGPELATFVESELGALLTHDAGHANPLLPTLRAFLANAGRKSDAVRELHIQRRTLYARLARLEALLGRSLEDQQDRTRLTLALQGLEILRDRPRPWHD